MRRASGSRERRMICSPRSSASCDTSRTARSTILADDSEKPPWLRDLTPEKRMLLALPKVDGADLLGHPPASNHGPGHRRRLADVVVGPGADGSEDFPLRGAPAEHHRQAIPQIVLRERVAFLLRHLLSATERPPARDDADLVDGIGPRQLVGDEGVARLVNRTGRSGKDYQRTGSAKRHLVTRLLEVTHLDPRLSFPGRENRRLMTRFLRSPPTTRTLSADTSW